MLNEKYKRSADETVLVVDGDIVAYRCAAASETRSIKVTHKPSGKEKVFKTRTEFRELMSSKGKEITEDYSIEDKQDAQPVENCLHSIKRMIEKAQEKVQADSVIVCCGEDWNFRSELPLPSKYKGQRTDMIRPLLLKDAKEYIRNKYKAISSVGRECDDEVCTQGYAAKSQGKDVVILSIDKDSFSHNGLWIMMTDNYDKIMLVPELGTLHKVGASVKGNGLKFLCHQLLFGDRSDCYIPYELSKQKFGEKASYSALVALPTVKDCLEKVVEVYKYLYPDKFEYKDWRGQEHEADWKSMLDIYFKCAWMGRTQDDKYDFRELFDKYGAKYA